MTPAQYFLKYFSIIPCTTAAQQEQTFRIRYQVYCKEFGFEEYAEGDPEIETDQYDAQSKHCLLIHNASQRAVGCARLILSNPRQPEYPLPFERFCRAAIDKSQFEPDEFLPGQIAEFSRIAVLEEFRRSEKNKSDLDQSSAQITNDFRVSNFPVISLSLFLASLSMLLNSDADWGFAMMEPKLERLLRRYGIIFKSVGEPIQYHGWRSPFIIHRDEIGRDFKHGIDDLFIEVNRALLKVQRKQKQSEWGLLLEEA